MKTENTFIAVFVILVAISVAYYMSQTCFNEFYDDPAGLDYDFEVYTMDDIYYISIDQLQIHSESGQIAKAFANHRAMREWLSNRTAHDSKVTNDFVEWFAEYIAVDTAYNIYFFNPYTDSSLKVTPNDFDGTFYFTRD